MDEEEIDTKAFLKFLKKLTLKDFIIIYLILIFILLFMFHSTEMDRCNKYFNDLISDKVFIERQHRLMTYGYDVNNTGFNIDIPIT